MLMAESKLKTKTEAAAASVARDKREMALSCRRCRLRKVKCNFAHPCLSCVKLGAECIRTPADMRKKRPPANYVSSLEKRIDSLSKIFLNFEKYHLDDELASYIRSASGTISELLVNQDTANTASEPQSNDTVASASTDSPAQHLRRVYGPTSAYDVDEDGPLASQINEGRESSTLHNLSKDADVLHCLKLFFTWQYPDHNMFVFREAFLAEFFNPKPNSLYCSLALVLSICALGARMSEVVSIYQKSITYYNEAKLWLLLNLERPSILALQSFMLLSFYDICNGNNSTGWMLSGNAVRMGFDLGFQLHPEIWFLKNRGAVKDLDVAIRLRIYWGCYMADHFISLVLGRPSSLKLLEATIPETEDLPELDGIDQYKYIPETATNISDPLRNIINLIEISDNMLIDVFKKSDDSSMSDHDFNLTRLSMMFEYNSLIQAWKEDLPPDLYWDQDRLQETSDNPMMSCVRYYYYILVLCLNRPFVGVNEDFGDKAHLAPVRVCFQAMDDLHLAIKKFELAHGLRKASIFIVYCAILSISVIFLSCTSNTLDPNSREKLKYFLNVLRGCSRTWALAEKSVKKIEQKLRLQFAHEPDLVPKLSETKKAKRSRKVDLKASSLVESTTSPAEDSQVREETEHTMNHDLDFFGFPVPVQTETEYFGGPPVLMTSDLSNEDWVALFPDSIISSRQVL